MKPNNILHVISAGRDEGLQNSTNFKCNIFSGWLDAVIFRYLKKSMLIIGIVGPPKIRLGFIIHTINWLYSTPAHTLVFSADTFVHTLHVRFDFPRWKMLENNRACSSFILAWRFSFHTEPLIFSLHAPASSGQRFAGNEKISLCHRHADKKKEPLWGLQSSHSSWPDLGWPSHLSWGVKWISLISTEAGAHEEGRAVAVAGGLEEVLQG